MKLSSTGSESCNLLSNGTSFLDQTSNQPLNTFSNQLPIGDNFSYSATINGGFGSSITTTAALPLEAHGDGLVGDIVRNVNQPISNQNHTSGLHSKQDYSQYSQNAFSTLASSALVSGGGLSGPVSHGRLNGGASTKLRYSDDYLVDQTNKLQGGFVGGNGYGSLDDIMTGMLKRV